MSQARDAEVPAGLREALDQVLGHVKSGNYDDALAACAAALASFTGAADALHLTAYLHQLKREDETALTWFARAARAAPANAEIPNNWGGSLKYLLRFEEAERMYKRSIQLDPAYATPHHNLAEMLLVLDRPAEALVHCRAAIELAPDFPDTYRMLGAALEAQGRPDEAIQAFRLSARQGGSREEAEFSESMARLRAGDYGAGWPLYEARLSSPRVRSLHERFDLPRWRGAHLAGRTLVVCREQGLGDEIMFASCFPDLLATGARCLITSDRRLAALLARSFPAAAILSGREEELRARVAGENADFQIAAGSLPLVFRSALRDFPRHEGYLRPDTARVAHWRSRLAALGPGPKIGLSWRGGTLHTGMNRRSLALAQLEPVLRHPGVHWISLQWDVGPGENLGAGGAPVHHWPEALADYDETAALLCALDQSISVCGSVIHLCGALGRPVWVMVPWLPEWRYGAAGETMPWYPAVRLFRQGAYGAWPPLIERVAAELAARYPG